MPEGDEAPEGYVPFQAQDSRQTSIIHTLTRVGLLAYAAWALWLFQVLYRVTQTTGGASAGAWEQRAETLAFIGFIPSLPWLAAPAVAASVATWMAGPTQQLELAILLRLTRWTANALMGVAVVSIGFAMFGRSGGFGDVGTIAFRAGGVLGALAISTLCREAGRNAPGG